MQNKEEEKVEKREEVFVFATPEIQALLADNGVDITELLQQDGQDVTKSFSRNPAEGDESGYKEPTTVILASAALVVALTPIVKNLISALTHKKIIVRDVVLVPVEDSKGNIVYDRNGDPVLNWVRKAEIKEFRGKVPGKSGFLIRGFGIEIKYNDSGEE